MPEWNPYQPPTADVSAMPPEAALGDGDVVPPRTGWATATVVCLGLCVVAALASMATYWGQIGILEEIASGAFDINEVHASDARVQLASVVELLILLVTGVCFFVWVAGANRTARSLAPGLVSDTPGWAVGWWFVPFANFYKPYVGLKEIWHASTVRPGAPADVDAPTVFPVWWTFWILRILPGYISVSMLNSAGTNAKQAILGSQIQMAAGFCDIVAAIAAIVVVRAVADVQDRAARSARPR